MTPDPYLPGGITDRDLDGGPECCEGLDVYDSCDTCLRLLAETPCECDPEYQCPSHKAQQELGEREREAAKVAAAREEAPRTEREAEPDVRY